MPHQPTSIDFLIQLAPLLIMGLIAFLVFIPICRRKKETYPVLWAFFCFLPLVNFFVIPHILSLTGFKVLNAIETLSAAKTSVKSGSYPDGAGVT